MRSDLLTLAFCAGAAASQLEGRASSWTVGQTVQTSSGPVEGHAAPVKSEVSEYLGIPFAVPPVGDLRWAAPQKYNGTETINGTSYGFSCPINLASFGGGSQVGGATANITAAGLQVLLTLAQSGDKFSEDCLTANVWTKPQVGDAKKAVLVWIYGGGFNTGNSDALTYQGQYIVDQQDVIIVSFNYRLNILGFPGAPGVTQNLGLLDQRLALEWVRDNIEAFGGDVNRITLFGQSAGGASVDYYTFAWTSDPIVNAFIPESGTAIGLGQATSEAAAASWNGVAKAVGCTTGSSPDDEVLTCMRGKPYTTLQSALANTTASSTISISFGPSIDETVVFSDYLARSKAGKFIKKPMLIGNTDNEFGLFRAIGAVGGKYYSDAYAAAFNDIGFNCPSSARANISIYNDVPTWRYRYHGIFPNLIIETEPQSGAWHASELALLFNVTPTGQNIPPSTPEQISIGDYMRGAWAAFAKDPVNGLYNYKEGWPKWNPSGDTLIRLAYDNVTGTNLAPALMYDGSCNSTFPVSETSTSGGGGSGSGGSGGSGTGTGTGTTSSPTASFTGGAERVGGLSLMVVGFAALSCLL